MSDDRDLNFAFSDDVEEGKADNPSRFPQHQRPTGLSSFQTLSIIVALLVTAALSFLGGVIYNRQQSLASSNEFEIFWDVWDRVESDYFFTEDIPSEQDRVYGAIQGFVSAYGDANTRFIPPTPAETSREQIEGRFGGIGAVVSLNENNEPYIVEVISDECIATTPAEEAGLQSNDIIRAVDGESVEGWSLDEVVERVRGLQGTTVTLSIYRPSEDEIFDVDVRRGDIESITATGEMLGDIAYVRLSLFNALATNQVLCRLDTLFAENPRAMILDLRGNPGGLLNEAQRMADLFLEEGLILTQRDRRGNADQLFSDDGDIGETIPLVVLVDGGSASASEVVAGALQDRGRATLIGQVTFGKGSVQNVYELEDGSELRVTAAAWFTPDNQRIEEFGLTPDIIVEGDQFDADGQDRVLNAALEYIEIHIPAEEGDPSIQLPERTPSSDRSTLEFPAALAIG